MYRRLLVRTANSLPGRYEESLVLSSTLYVGVSAPHARISEWLVGSHDMFMRNVTRVSRGEFIETSDHDMVYA